MPFPDVFNTVLKDCVHTFGAISPSDSFHQVFPETFYVWCANLPALGVSGRAPHWFIRCKELRLKWCMVDSWEMTKLSFSFRHSIGFSSVIFHFKLKKNISSVSLLKKLTAVSSCCRSCLNTWQINYAHSIIPAFCFLITDMSFSKFCVLSALSFLLNKMTENSFQLQGLCTIAIFIELFVFVMLFISNSFMLWLLVVTEAMYWHTLRHNVQLYSVFYIITGLND